MKLVDFYRNTAFDNRYDENSFIGKILNYNLWSDDEYWKLEADLQKLLRLNLNKIFIKQEIMEGIFSICNDVFLTQKWDFIKIDSDILYKNNPNIIDKEPNIYDRFRRLKRLLVAVAYGDENFFNIDFVYKKPEVSCKKDSKKEA
ncbi:Imm41 family immunity protein [Campylobacter geochelonis]|uniref:Imm41 family immunity protein n=1 Tax=Campylobacter geochelonis TaxID=1780362 RepID=UPI000770A343|nr:Imm41 family immunity protein [Campylobacter geochelonis]CZE49748.1 Uncharacterised protein [Campylobacter geochelonis]